MIYEPIPHNRCKHCGSFKAWTPKYFCVGNKRRLMRVCRACESKRVKEHHNKHPEQQNARSRKYYAANKEWIATRNDKYRKQHMDQYRSTVQRRRAIKLQSEGTHTYNDLLEQLKRQKHRCYYCGKQLKDKWEADHVIPLTRGGRDDMSNIVIACVSCNRRKQKRFPHEWPEGGRLL